MAEPLFLPSSGIGSSPESLSRQPFPSVSWAVLPALFPACYSLHLSSFPPLFTAIFPVVFSCTASVPPLSFPCPPPASSRAPFSPLFPSVLPRILACAFHAGSILKSNTPVYGLLFIIVFCFLIFAFFMKNKYICWVVKRKLIFRLLFLCLPGASRLFLSGIFRKG